jgi:polyhydroxybutyrate depolymerase
MPTTISVVRLAVAVVVPLAVLGGFAAAMDASVPRVGPRFATAGDHDVALPFRDRERSYLVRLPPRFRQRGPLPVVLAFHGGGGTARVFKAYARLDAVADREGFVAVYPDGTGPFRRSVLTWNAGDCCGWASEHGVDDVGFALAVLDDLARDLPVDHARVYATGHSNGAMMAYRLAVDASPRIAAIAAVAGAAATDRLPAGPVPVLHVHSVDDARAVYAGGYAAPFPFAAVRVRHRPVEPTLGRWAEHNGCPGDPAVMDRRATERAGRRHTATLHVWAGCPDNAEVALWRLTGAGHGWPGSTSPLPEVWMGPDTDVLDAAEEGWRFLRRFSRARS